MDVKISECQTVTELTTLENLYVLNEFEQGLVFERKVEIISRLLEWGMENEQMGLAANLTDSWTPGQREKFLLDWNNDEPLVEMLANEDSQLHDLTHQWPTEERERFYRDWQDDEPLLQTGRGEKRSIDEVNDGASTSNEVNEVNNGASNEVSDNFFTVTATKQVKVKKFKTTGIDYTVQFTDTFAHLELSQFHNRLHEIFESLLNTVTEGIPEHDQVRFVLQSPVLDPPITVPFMQRQRLTPERILAEIERVIQSNKQFRLNDSVKVNLIHVEMPHGGTGTKRSEINLEKHLAKKGSIVRIQNKDELCLARALVVAIAKIEKDNRYKQIANHRYPMQTRLANELHQKARVEIGSCGLDEVKQFQTYLTDYQINVVSKDHLNSIVFSGPDKEKRIYLFLHDIHYDVITSIPAFFARKKYCHTCKKAYDHLRDHMCPDACKSCRFPNCPFVSWVLCVDCNRCFRSVECFDRHKQNIGNGKSICSDIAKCKRCSTVMERGRLSPDVHHCGLTYCKICKDHVNTENHQCYMRPEKDTREIKLYDQLLFFDFECRQENGNHEPNLCVIQNEAGDEWVFEGDNTTNEFCEWLFTKEHANCTVLAHNLQGYDSYFILQYLHANAIIPEVITRGAKVLSITVPQFKIKFIDSLCFIPMRLADFPKTFGLDELAKGYFPHLFNRKENEKYIGPLPPSPYYNPDGMSPEEKEKFLQWHNELKETDYMFDFQREILSYCQSDVDILRRSCLEFRELFRDVTDIDPFAECLTIASACHLVFRTKFLKENTVAVIPPLGYRPKDKQSLLALKWLSYKAEKEDLYIQHVRNAGEKRVDTYLLDGYHQETNTAYEINGCFWHGKFFLFHR